MASRYMGPRGDDIIVGSGDIPGLGITADSPRVGGDRMFIGEGAPRSVNVPNIQPIVPPTIASAPSFKKDIFPTRREPTMDPLSGLTPEIVEALNLRKEATDAATAATDQYEADVADYKNTMATEAEQGIASLPEVDFKKDIFPTRPTGTEPPSMMGITMDPAPDPITGDRYPVISIEEEPAVDFKKDPVPAMSMVEQLQQMIADMQAQQQTQAAQQQEQAAARAAQEAEMSKQYLIPAGPQGYNPYLSGQYQGDPYGAQGVPSMGGITTIPVPEDYLGV
tara:strand:- start:543 stop:1382 length:840 start_codon:yes stop_codon:yes gene_type:complete